MSLTESGRRYVELVFVASQSPGRLNLTQIRVVGGSRLVEVSMMFCPVCDTWFTKNVAHQKYCSRECAKQAQRERILQRYYDKKQPERVLYGREVHPEVFTQLLKFGIIVEYQNGSKNPVFGLKPDARRAIFGLGEPHGFTSQKYVEMSKMKTKTALRGHLDKPTNGRFVPHRESGVIAAQEGE